MLDEEIINTMNVITDELILLKKKKGNHPFTAKPMLIDKSDPDFIFEITKRRYSIHYDQLSLNPFRRCPFSKKRLFMKRCVMITTLLQDFNNVKHYSFYFFDKSAYTEWLLFDAE
jgi:hypothetical protein